MNKSKIEWTDYTINPVKGYCPMACPYCYARRMYDRFKWDKTIRYDPKPLLEIAKINKPSRIFVGSIIELFGEWVDAFWLDGIFRTVREYPQHQFIFLTKCPWNLAKWNPWPNNCWVGATACNGDMFDVASYYLFSVEASVRFVSLEPLLEPIIRNFQGIDWVIIGGKSGTSPFYPPEEWVQEIEEEADRLGIPVFEKDNLAKLLQRPLRQEYPKEVIE